MSELKISDINKLVLDDPFGLVIKSEDEYHGLVDSVAKRISSDKRVRILLLAGPSGSGKTTTANLICDRIKAYGEECIVVSLDDFYRAFDDPEYPTLADGSLDPGRVRNYLAMHSEASDSAKRATSAAKKKQLIGL